MLWLAFIVKLWWPLRAIGNDTYFTVNIHDFAPKLHMHGNYHYHKYIVAVSLRGHRTKWLNKHFLPDAFFVVITTYSCAILGVRCHTSALLTVAHFWTMRARLLAHYNFHYDRDP